jgi:hypothetical protein
VNINQAAMAAKHYALEGYRPIPIPKGSKGPVIKGWPEFRVDPERFHADFPFGSNIGILLGDGLVCVDLDCTEALELAPGFLPQTGCVIGRSGRPQCHWFYWVGPIEMGNKSWRAKIQGENGKPQAQTLIDLLSDGKQVVVGPSVHPSGDLYDPLAGTPESVEAGYLLESIEALAHAVLAKMEANGVALIPEEPPRQIIPRRLEVFPDQGERPGDAFNRQHPGDLLSRHGWALIGTRGEKEHWRRPGKAEGISATLSPINGVWVFYNFSSSAPNLEANKGYDPLGLLAALEHGGDIAEASRALRLEGFGGEAFAPIEDPLPGLNAGRKAPKVEATGREVIVREAKEPTALQKPDDLEPFPEECLRAPGFLELVCDYNLRTASRKQPELALGAALALLSVVTGNRVKSFVNHTTYTNLYVLGLAPTGAGKDHGRKINQAILDAAGHGELQGATRLGSHAGIISALEQQPTLLLPVDEIGDLLQRIKGSGSKAPYLATIPDLLKILKHAVGRNYKDAVLSGGVKEIISPHLVLYGTTTPDGFWEGLTFGQARDGLLSRCLVFESRGYVKVTQAIDQEPPEGLVRLVQFWRREFGGGGNLRDIKATHISAEIGQDAYQRFLEHESQIGDKQVSEGETDPMRAALWSRTAENTNQLALLAACSRVMGEPGEIPVISLSDMNWAIRLSNWQTRRLVIRMDTQVAESDWDGIVKKCQNKLFDGITLREFRRRTKAIKPQDLDNAVKYLTAIGFIDRLEDKIPNGGGTKSKVFRLGGKP